MNQRPDIQTYLMPATQLQIEFEVKRSKFLSFVGLADSKLVADNFIRDLREKHPKANHVCWAYTHVTSKCAFQNDWGASIRDASMTECRPPSELTQRRSGVPQTFPSDGF